MQETGLIKNLPPTTQILNTKNNANPQSLIGFQQSLNGIMESVKSKSYTATDHKEQTDLNTLMDSVLKGIANVDDMLHNDGISNDNLSTVKNLMKNLYDFISQIKGQKVDSTDIKKIQLINKDLTKMVSNFEKLNGKLVSEFGQSGDVKELRQLSLSINELKDQLTNHTSFKPNKFIYPKKPDLLDEAVNISKAQSNESRDKDGNSLTDILTTLNQLFSFMQEPPIKLGLSDFKINGDSHNLKDVVNKLAGILDLKFSGDSPINGLIYNLGLSLRNLSNEQMNFINQNFGPDTSQRLNQVLEAFQNKQEFTNVAKIDSDSGDLGSQEFKSLRSSNSNNKDTNNNDSQRRDGFLSKPIVFNSGTMNKVQQLLIHTGSKQSQSVAEQISDNIKSVILQGQFKNLADGTLQLTIKLHPGNLGSVQVILNQTDEGLMATITAQMQSTKDLIQSQITDLKHSLTNSGLMLQKVDVVHVDQSQSNQSQQGHDPNNPNQQQDQQQQESESKQRRFIIPDFGDEEIDYSFEDWLNQGEL